MSDSDEEDEKALRKQKKVGSKRKEPESDEGSDESGDESEKEEQKGKKGGKKGPVEDPRKDREAERERREAEQKKKEEENKRVSLFLGESHGHYKMGVFVRIELQIQKKYSRNLVPEYPVILCSLRH